MKSFFLLLSSFFSPAFFCLSLSYYCCLPPIPLLPPLCSSVLFSSTLSSLIPQAYYFDDSDDQSVSDINPLIRRPPSQATTRHTHIITGYLSAVEAIVLVRWKLVSVPDTKPTLAQVAFSIVRAHRMRSGDETRWKLEWSLIPTTRYMYMYYSVYMYIFTVYALSAHLNDLWTNTCITFSGRGKCFWGGWPCATKCEQCERMAKHTLKEFEEWSVVLNSSLNARICSFLKMAMQFRYFASCCSFLAYSLISSQTSHGKGCTLALWLRFHFCASLLSLPHRSLLPF